MTFKQRINNLKYTWQTYQEQHPVLAVVDIILGVIAIIASLVYILK